MSAAAPAAVAPTVAPPRDEPPRADHVLGDLRRRSVRGGAATLAAQAGKFALQFGSTALLARLLTPKDYGLIAMVTAVTGFVAIFKDLGLSAATVQRKEITRQQSSNLFWINVACSVALMLILVAAAPLIARFYKHPELTWVTIALSASFIFGGLTAQHQALLRRQMRFGALARIEVAAMACGVAAALIAAWFGLRYWALVLMIVVQAASNMVMVWIASPWTPSLPAREAQVGSMLKFGGNLTGFNIVNYFTRNADNLLIGWFWGDVLLGLYSKAYQLLLLPLNQVAAPVSSVVLPALSRLQDDPERYRNYYRKAMTPLALMILPIVVFMAADAHAIVRIVLGEKWLEAAVLFQLLAPAALVGGLNVATGWVYQSLGRTDRQLRWGVLASVLTVSGFAIALPWGTWAVAATFSVTVCLLRWPSIVYCFRGTPLTQRDLLSVMWRPLVASLVAGSGVLLAHRQFAAPNAIVRIAADGIVFVGLYLAAWLALPGGAKILSGLMGLFSELRSKAAEP